MTALAVSIITFLIATMIFIAIWLSLRGESKHELLRQRMDAVQRAERRGGISVDLQFVRDELYSSLPALHRLMLRFPSAGRLKKYMAQAGLNAKPGKLVLQSVVALVATFIIVDQFGGFFPGLLLGIVAGLVPLAIVAYKRRKRLGAFEEHFPEALDLLGRAVRAGHAFTSGIEMVAKETTEPIAGEFSTCFEEQKFGLPLRDTLLNFAERMPLVDVRFFVTTLLVQKETGGNLAEILDELARVIRERFRIYREVRVKTAMGRLTAVILISLPILMMAMLELTSPDYENALFTDPIGPLVLGVALLLQVVGSVIIWKIVHIEV